MKITSEEVEPIDSKYSKELNAIVMGLLTKDQNQRKSLEEILKMPYMQKFMQQYGNKIDEICETIPLKKIAKEFNKVEPTAKSTIKEKSMKPEDTMQTIKSNF